MQEYDVVVIGAGAAGLMCAATAGARGRRVLLLDHADQAGKKILISGGGRCNFTNRTCTPDRYLSANPRFCRSALARYTPDDFIALVDKHRIAFHEKTLGQLFCDGSARQVVAMLLAECQAAGVTLRLAQQVTEISRADRYRIETSGGTVHAAALVVATGGLSIPKMGATGFAHAIARQFGVALTDTRPALVPLVFTGADGALMQDLSGVSLDTVARCGRQAFQEATLFTHRGLSGPAILQVSSYLRDGDAVQLDLLPGTDATRFLLDRKRSRPKADAKTVLAECLPGRLAATLAAAHLPARPVGDQRDGALTQLGALLNNWTLRAAGSEGYAKAEVTRGGVDTRALSSQTMAVTAVPGLHFIGEAVDVTGWLGGYNFQWAWSSGWAAGQGV